MSDEQAGCDPFENGFSEEAVRKLYKDEITRLRADLAAVTEERDRLREALKPFANMLEEKFKIHQHDDTWIALVNHDVLMRLCNAARAALEGATEPASPWRDIESAPKDGTIIFVWDESSRPEIVAAYYTNDYWVYADQLLADADPEGPIASDWMPLPIPPR